MKKEPIPKGDEIIGSIARHMDRRFLGSIDLVGFDETIVTILRVELHKKIKFENGKEESNIKMIYFEENPKPLVIRDVHIRAITTALGTVKVKDWKGRKVAMYVEKGHWFGKDGYAVRFRTKEAK